MPGVMHALSIFMTDEREGERMKIKEIVHQNRRDFKAVFECEHCGHTYEDWGYDDTNYHQNVLPKKVCPGCGKTSPNNYRPLATRYPDGMVV